MLPLNSNTTENDFTGGQTQIYLPVKSFLEGCLLAPYPKREVVFQSVGENEIRQVRGLNRLSPHLQMQIQLLASPSAASFLD